MPAVRLSWMGKQAPPSAIIPLFVYHEPKERSLSLKMEIRQMFYVIGNFYNFPSSLYAYRRLSLPSGRGDSHCEAGAVSCNRAKNDEQDGAGAKVTYNSGLFDSTIF
jgi:hypothetical protein